MLNFAEYRDQLTQVMKLITEAAFPKLNIGDEENLENYFKIYQKFVNDKTEGEYGTTPEKAIKKLRKKLSKELNKLKKEENHLLGELKNSSKEKEPIQEEVLFKDEILEVQNAYLVFIEVFKTNLNVLTHVFLEPIDEEQQTRLSLSGPEVQKSFMAAIKGNVKYDVVREVLLSLHRTKSYLTEENQLSECAVRILEIFQIYNVLPEVIQKLNLALVREILIKLIEALNTIVIGDESTQKAYSWGVEVIYQMLYFETGDQPVLMTLDTETLLKVLKLFEQKLKNKQEAEQAIKQIREIAYQLKARQEIDIDVHLKFIAILNKLCEDGNDNALVELIEIHFLRKDDSIFSAMEENDFRNCLEAMSEKVLKIFCGFDRVLHQALPNAIAHKTFHGAPTAVVGFLFEKIDEKPLHALLLSSKEKEGLPLIHSFAEKTIVCVLEKYANDTQALESTLKSGRKVQLFHKETLLHKLQELATFEAIFYFFEQKKEVPRFLALMSQTTDINKNSVWHTAPVEFILFMVEHFEENEFTGMLTNFKNDKGETILERFSAQQVIQLIEIYSKKKNLQELYDLLTARDSKEKHILWHCFSEEGKFINENEGIFNEIKASLKNDLAIFKGVLLTVIDDAGQKVLQRLDKNKVIEIIDLYKNDLQNLNALLLTSYGADNQPLLFQLPTDYFYTIINWYKKQGQLDDLKDLLLTKAGDNEENYVQHLAGLEEEVRNEIISNIIKAFKGNLELLNDVLSAELSDGCLIHALNEEALLWFLQLPRDHDNLVSLRETITAINEKKQTILHGCFLKPDPKYTGEVWRAVLDVFSNDYTSLKEICTNGEPKLIFIASDAFKTHLIKVFKKMINDEDWKREFINIFEKNDVNKENPLHKCEGDEGYEVIQAYLKFIEKDETEFQSPQHTKEVLLVINEQYNTPLNQHFLKIIDSISKGEFGPKALRTILLAFKEAKQSENGEQNLQRILEAILDFAKTKKDYDNENWQGLFAEIFEIYKDDLQGLIELLNKEDRHSNILFFSAQQIDQLILHLYPKIPQQVNLNYLSIDVYKSLEIEIFLSKVKGMKLGNELFYEEPLACKLLVKASPDTIAMILLDVVSFWAIKHNNELVNDTIDITKYFKTKFENISDIDRNTILHLFPEAIMKTLEAQLKKESIQWLKDLLLKTNNDGDTVLHKASDECKQALIRYFRNDAEMLIELFSSKDANENTPLHKANDETLKVLIELADKNSIQNLLLLQNTDGDTVLHKVSDECKQALIQYFHNDAEMLRDLFSSKDANDNSPLHKTSDETKLAIIEAVNDSDIIFKVFSQVNREASNPLHNASPEVFNAILKKIDDKDKLRALFLQPNTSKETPLHFQPGRIARTFLHVNATFNFIEKLFIEEDDTIVDSDLLIELLQIPDYKENTPLFYFSERDILSLYGIFNENEEDSKFLIGLFKHANKEGYFLFDRFQSDNLDEFLSKNTLNSSMILRFLKTKNMQRQDFFHKANGKLTHKNLTSLYNDVKNKKEFIGLFTSYDDSNKTALHYYDPQTLQIVLNFFITNRILKGEEILGVLQLEDDSGLTVLHRVLDPLSQSKDEVKEIQDQLAYYEKQLSDFKNKANEVDELFANQQIKRFENEISSLRAEIKKTQGTAELKELLFGINGIETLFDKDFREKAIANHCVESLQMYIEIHTETLFAENGNQFNGEQINNNTVGRNEFEEILLNLIKQSQLGDEYFDDFCAEMLPMMLKTWKERKNEYLGCFQRVFKIDNVELPFFNWIARAQCTNTLLVLIQTDENILSLSKKFEILSYGNGFASVNEYSPKQENIVFDRDTPFNLLFKSVLQLIEPIDNRAEVEDLNDLEINQLAESDESDDDDNSESSDEVLLQGDLDELEEEEPLLIENEPQPQPLNHEIVYKSFECLQALVGLINNQTIVDKPKKDGIVTKYDLRNVLPLSIAITAKLAEMLCNENYQYYKTGKAPYLNAIVLFLDAVKQKLSSECYAENSGLPRKKASETIADNINFLKENLKYVRELGKENPDKDNFNTLKNTQVEVYHSSMKQQKGQAQNRFTGTKMGDDQRMKAEVVEKLVQVLLLSSLSIKTSYSTTLRQQCGITQAHLKFSRKGGRLNNANSVTGRVPTNTPSPTRSTTSEGQLKRFSEEDDSHFNQEKIAQGRNSESISALFSSQISGSNSFRSGSVNNSKSKDPSASEGDNENKSCVIQ